MLNTKQVIEKPNHVLMCHLMHLQAALLMVEILMNQAAGEVVLLLSKSTE